MWLRGAYVFAGYGVAILEKTACPVDPLSVSVTGERLLYRSNGGAWTAGKSMVQAGAAVGKGNGALDAFGSQDAISLSRTLLSGGSDAARLPWMHHKEAGQR